MKKESPTGTGGAGCNTTEIDFTEAERFLQTLDLDGAFTFQTFGDSRKDPSLTKVLNGSFDQHKAELACLNEQGAGVFVTINRTDLKGRKAENIIGVRSVFLDLDGGRLPEEWPLEPHTIVESSPGRWHAYWLVEEGFLPTQFEGVQKAIAAKFNGDPAVHDLPRVMRIPGFVHQKKDPFLSRVDRDWSSEPKYTAEQILAAFPPVEEPTKTRPDSGSNDPILKALEARSMLIRPDRTEKGKYYILCPWSSEHTAGDAEAAYWQPHTGGKPDAGFKCLHSHCANRTVRDLRSFLGIEKPKDSKAILKMVSEIAAKEISWLWNGYFPLGALCLIDGDPGLGKSFFTLDLAARVSAGKVLPTGERAGAGGVVLISFEDDPGVTIRPRLENMGADLSKIVLLEGIRGDEEKSAPRLPTIADLDAIREAARIVGARLVIVDPLMASLPISTDAHSDQNIRNVLAPLSKLAQETGATVLIVRHLNKSGGGNALYRGGGSIGIVAVARAAFLVAKDPKDPSRRVLAVTKMNIAPEPEALQYRILTNDRGAPFLSWEGKTDLKAHDLLAEPAKERFPSRNKREQAKNFLMEALKNGPVSRNRLEQEANKMGISEETLRRAKKDLAEEDFPILAEKKGGVHGFWVWTFEGGQPSNSDPLYEEGKKSRLPRSEGGQPLLSDPVTPFNETVGAVDDFKGGQKSPENDVTPFKNSAPIKGVFKGGQQHFITHARDPLDRNPLFEESDFLEVD